MNDAVHYSREIGQALRALRLRYMLKQAEVAERLGVQKAAVARWERGTRVMSVPTLLTIADVFGIPASQLLPPAHQISAPPADTGTASDAVTRITALLRSRPDLVAPVLDVLLAQIAAPDAEVTAGGNDSIATGE